MLDPAKRPEAGEFASFYEGYVALVPEGHIVETLKAQLDDTQALLRGLPPEKGRHAYAPGKWTLGQLVGHVADAERVFAYRALCFARGETQDLPGFEENTYAAQSPASGLDLLTIAEDLAVVRRATLSLFSAFTPEAWSRRGVANGKPVTVRALAWIMAGHERHHLKVLRERYLAG